MQMLELFSGTGSVGNVARLRGWEVISLDRDMPAQIRADVMNWDYSSIPEHSFDFIWASPPCTEYSIAKTVGVRKIEEANAITQRTLEIIQKLAKKYWVLENPQTGKMKEQPFMQGLPFKDVDYCTYGYLYRKRTRLWNCMPIEWTPRPLCRKDCHAMDANGRAHIEVAQRGPSKSNPNSTTHRQDDLYRIPSELVNEILANVEDSLREPT